MTEDDSSLAWDSTDVKMAIKRYFYNLERGDSTASNQEIDFMRSIHREWSYHPLMRRVDSVGIAIIDDFLRWFDKTPIENHLITDFTIRRLVR